MERLIEHERELLGEEVRERLQVVRVHEPVAEHAEALVDPEARHRRLRVLEVLVAAQQPLEHLRSACSLLVRECNYNY